MLLALIDGLKDVETDGKLHVRRIEVHHVVDAVRRNEVQKLLGGVAVRVDVREAVPGVNVGQHHVLEQRRLAHARLSDHVDVPAAVIGLDAEATLLIAKIGLPEEDDFVLVIVLVGRNGCGHGRLLLAEREVVRQAVAVFVVARLLLRLGRGLDLHRGVPAFGRQR